MSDERREMNFFEFLALIGRSIINFFKIIGVFILKTFRLAVHYWWIVLICMVLGFVAAYFISQDKNVKYKGEATIYFSPLLRSQIQQGLAQYPLVVLNSETAKSLTSLSTPQAYLFRKLNTFNIIDSKNDSIADFVDYDNKGKFMADTFNVVMPDRLLIRVVAKGTDNFNEYKNSLIEFFQSQPTMLYADAKRKEIEKQQLEIIERDMLRLDTFSTYDYLQKPGILSMEMGRTMLISERKQEIYSRHLIAAIKRYQYTAMQMAQTPDIINFQTDFMVTRFPKIWMWFIGVLVGGIFGLLIALIIKYRKEIHTYMPEK